jgi:hypothetical protein
MTSGHNTICKCLHVDLCVNTWVSVPYDSLIDLSENWELSFLIDVESFVSARYMEDPYCTSLRFSALNYRGLHLEIDLHILSLLQEFYEK